MRPTEKTQKKNNIIAPTGHVTTLHTFFFTNICYVQTYSSYSFISLFSHQPIVVHMLDIRVKRPGFPG